MTHLLALLLAAGLADAAPRPAKASPAVLGDQPYGVLLLGEEGGRDLQDALAAMTTTFAGQFPLDYAGAGADVRTIQKAVDRLQARHVKKLVVVPLFASSGSPLMEQTRYLFGVRQDPCPEFFTAAHRPSGYSIVRRVELKGKLPVVLAQALDDAPAVIEVLASRALALSKRPDSEALVLVGLAPAEAPADESVLTKPGAGPRTPSAAEQYRQTISSIAERVRARGGFKSAHAAVLEPQAFHQSDRQRLEEELRALVRGLSRGGTHVLVVPCVVTGGEASRHVARALQGTFMRYNEKGLLPDPRIVRWVADSVRRSLPLPDMRVYKDAGRPLPGAVKPLSVKLSGSRQ